jgi:hypothetical protein
MEIKRGIIKRYLNNVTSCIGDEGALPDNVTGYHNSAINMRKLAEYEGDVSTLLLGIDCLLLDPSLDAPSFSELFYHFDPDEMQELLKYIRFVAFPDAPPLNPEAIKDIELV